MTPMRQRLRWLALHGVIRVMATYGARRGEIQGRMIADPKVRADPGGFADELRAGGPLVRGRAGVDDRRPRDRQRPVALRRLRRDVDRVHAARAVGLARAQDPVKGRLHPLLPPSMLSVEPPEHTRYRKIVSSVFTTRAVAALRERVELASRALIDEL